MEINENLKALRKGAGLTQSDFAEKTGVHFQTVSKWERGASVPDVANYYVCDYCRSKWIIDSGNDVHAVERANA